jgi:phosphoesterase RecJ-like protein
MNYAEMQNVIDEVLKRDDFLVTAHVNPEGDSIGSQLAFMHILRSQGKKAYIIDQDAVPENLRFLKGSSEISSSPPGGFLPRVVIVLDCPVLERIGNVRKQIAGAEYIINIDHHVSNTNFGDVNWVEPLMSSCGEMVYHMMRRMVIKPDAAAAAAMYTAIITDTGMFNYNNTSPATHEVAAELINIGLKPREMQREIFENKNVVQVRMLGRVLTTLSVEPCGKIAHITMTRRMQEEEGVTSVPTEDFINFPRSVKGIEAAVLFSEKSNEKDIVNVSFRSNGKIDVNKVATYFGGGGHKSASGCLLRGDLEQVKRNVIKKLTEVLKEGS